MNTYKIVLNNIDRMVSSKSRVTKKEIRMYEEDVAAHFRTIKNYKLQK